MVLLQTPYIIFGTATDINGSAIQSVVYLKNESSGEILSVETNSLGQYVFDCANFPSGWANGDVLTIYVAEATIEIYASHNGGISWYQVDNEEDYSFDINSLKVKVDQTNYPGGREIKVIYPI